MKKHLRILDLALAGLLLNKGRLLSTVLVYSFVVFLLASVLFLVGALRHEAALLLQNTPDLIVQKLQAGRHDLIPLDTITEIEKIRGVRGVEPRYWGYYYDPPTGVNYTIIGQESFSLEDPEIIDGEPLDPDEIWACLIGAGIAESRILEPGDIIPVKDADGELRVLRVSGIFSPDSQLLTNDLVVTGLETWRILFGIQEGVATDLVVDVPNSAELDTVSLKIVEVLPGARVIRHDMILRTYDALFNWRGTLVLLVSAGALLAFGIFAWDMAGNLNREEQKKIGILKAVGWEVPDVLELKLMEGFSISLLSFLIGTVTAHIHVFWLGSGLLVRVMKGWSVIFPEFHLRPQAEPFVIFTLFALTVIPYTLVTLIPSWKVSILEPDSVMR